MRRIYAQISAILALSATVAMPALAMETVIVALDRAKIVKVPSGTQTMVIGNPLVADVTLLKGNDTMVLTGRSFGSTNLILLGRERNADCGIAR